MLSVVLACFLLFRRSPARHAASRRTHDRCFEEVDLAARLEADLIGLSSSSGPAAAEPANNTLFAVRLSQTWA